ncbi:MAG: 16S rRNA processing protein RimM [Spirochaetales bacterium]|nr:16S rRNA processing protein RimM [Candidatus Physcosoma equi]
MEAQLLATATIGKTHGVEGFLRVYSLSGETAHLKKLKACIVVTQNGEELSLCIDAIKATGDLFLMKFSGYDAPEKARFLTKATIMIPRSAAPKLKKGEYYIADLYHMDVLVDGIRVGEVIDTREGAQALMLVVKKDSDSKEYLVPNLPVYIQNVDIKKNSLDLIAPFLLED